MRTRLQHRTALVTGATSNIGRAIATAFGAEGAHVIVSGRSERRGVEVVQTIRAAGGRADFIAAELDGSAKASRGLAGQATRTLGGHIDILVNSAGIFPGPTTPATNEATFDEVYAVNVKAPFFLTAAIAPTMVEHQVEARAKCRGARSLLLARPPCDAWVVDHELVFVELNVGGEAPGPEADQPVA